MEHFKTTLDLCKGYLTLDQTSKILNRYHKVKNSYLGLACTEEFLESEKINLAKQILNYACMNLNINTDLIVSEEYKDLADEIFAMKRKSKDFLNDDYFRLTIEQYFFIINNHNFSEQQKVVMLSILKANIESNISIVKNKTLHKKK